MVKLTRRVHVSWLIASVAGGAVVGIASAQLAAHIFYSPAWLVLATGLLVVVWTKRVFGMISLALCAGLLIGLWRGSSVRVDLSGYTPFYNQRVQLQGRVTEDPATGRNGEQQLQLTNIRVNDTVLPGTVWVNLAHQSSALRSDTVTVSGTLAPGFGTYPAAMFRATPTQVQATQQDVGRNVRDWFAGHIRLAIAEPQASLGIGFLTGQRSTLPQDLVQQLQILGLTHIVVASGYNLTILVRLARQVFARISKYLATLAGGAMIAGFLLVTGLSPSMSRAGLITGLSLAAWYYGRTIHPFVLLPLAAAVTALANPAYVWGDVGWYLSFAAFGGVIVLAPLLRHFFWGKNNKLGVVRRIVIETTSAQITTLPLIAFVFGNVALLALPANLLILPLIPITMLLTFIAGIGGWLAPAIASIVGAPASLTLHYMTLVPDWLARIPGAQTEVQFNVWVLVISYVVIVTAMIGLWRKTRHNFGKDSIIN